MRSKNVEKYDIRKNNISNQWMHLTNYSLNKDNPDYKYSENADKEDQGSKWTLGALLRYLRKHFKADVKSIMNNIEDVIIKTVISAQSKITQEDYLT